jgi:hypothetical protein
MKTSGAEPIEAQLNKCDAALRAKIKEADLCDYGIKIRDDARVLDQKEIAELRSAQSAWHKNPFLWATVGMLVGAYAGIRAVR